MLTIKKQYIVDEKDRKVAVQLGIETFKIKKLKRWNIPLDLGKRVM